MTYSPAMAAFVDAREQAVIASMAHMTNADLERQIAALAEERSQPLYAILVSSYREQKSGDDLFTYRRELERRVSLPAKQEQAA